MQSIIQRTAAFIRNIPPEGRQRGRGIVICGGGERYLPGAWVCIRRLQDFECTLPIQLWFLGRGELSPRTQRIFESVGVTCVNAETVRQEHPCRILNGYELKPFAILYSSFREVLLVDADNVPAANPEYLFRMPVYRELGAVFWPRRQKGPDPKVWEIFDVPYRAEWKFDTAQILVNKSKVWKALQLSLWYNQHSDYYYQFSEGEKETFHLAFRKLGTPYFLITTQGRVVPGAIYQHDHRARRIFQHRRGAKWSMYDVNKHINDFQGELQCLQHIQELKQRLSQVAARKTRTSELALRCPIDGFTGYGLHAQELINHFSARGCRISVLPTRVVESHGLLIPSRIKNCFVDYSDSDWELLLHPPTIAPKEGKNSIFFTMWESTRLAPAHMENVRKARLVIVPCEWNASTFSAQGIDVPIMQCPLGIDDTIFSIRGPGPSNGCVFGAAANSHISGRTRKGLDDVIKAFLVAFPKERDVMLKIKTLPESEIIRFQDPRISVCRKYFSQAELAEWYASLTCFVSAARGEGWGLMQHQSMAVGRPVIACAFGGLREFFDASVGYCVEYKLELADGRYSGLGIWARPLIDSLVEQMRKVYSNKDEAARLGVLAHERAHQFTWARSNQRLYSMVNNFVRGD